MSDDLIERLRERDAVWQKQCDGWVENWKSIGGMDADEAVRLRRTVYAEAADALAAKDTALSEMRQTLQKLANEVGGLIAFEPEVRQAIGNTNWAVLQQRLAEVDTLLSARALSADLGVGG